MVLLDAALVCGSNEKKCSSNDGNLNATLNFSVVYKYFILEKAKSI